MFKTQKQIDELKSEVSSLKTRVRSLEHFLMRFPRFDYHPNEEIDQDELLAQAKNIIVQYDRASASLLQRRLTIGYARAARLIDQLEQIGVVGPGIGSMPREVLVKESS